MKKMRKSRYWLFLSSFCTVGGVTTAVLSLIFNILAGAVFFVLFFGVLMSLIFFYPYYLAEKKPDKLKGVWKYIKMKLGDQY
jgi:hypothetical protein